MPSSGFVHLHVHTHYSILDGAGRIPDLVARAKKCRMPALAITDHGNLFGAIEFYEEAVEAGINPVLGYEAYVAPERRQDRTGTAGEAAYHLTLLCENETGYRNLLKLASSAYLEGFYYRPRIDKELFAAHHEGLIALSGCLSGEAAKRILAGDEAGARAALGFYREILGPERFFVELQHNGLEEQARANRSLLALAKELSLETVATADVHYLDREDAEAHDVLLCVQTGKKLADVGRMRFHSDAYYFKSPDEMRADFAEVPDAVARTVEIASRCRVEFDLSTFHMPPFPTPAGESAESFLAKLAEGGLRRRFGEPSAEARARLRFELDVISRMGFAGYYLIVWDFVRFAKEQGIPVGPGRGSGAGSLVAYVLEITDLDPLKYGLLFERFLNPGRKQMPDFDIDFCQERRGEMIKYVTDRYGADRVAQIITFGRMAAKASVRDVGRVLDVSLPEVDAIAKKIPGGPGVTLAGALKSEPELAEAYARDAQVKRIIDLAKRLEGLCRQSSTHAAGVVITDRPLTEYVPLYRQPGTDLVATQYDWHVVVEKLGLVKMDFLGLQTLTILDKCVKLLAARGVEVSLARLPLEAPEVYALLGRAESEGVFQLESGGMRELLVKMKPDCFEDLIALVALYRPGPLGSGMVESYVECKHGRRPAEYPHPSLEPILRETHGIILYQEQVMAIARELAGFSLGDGDSMRRAMGKKIPEVMQQFRQQFVDGCGKNGIDARTAGLIFDQMEYFAGYGFNKSHSACYAMLTYQTAYLKTFHPVEFMAAVLTCESGKIEKIVQYVDEARRMGIEVLPPDVNESGVTFRPTPLREGEEGGEEKDRIRFGLVAVKGVGGKAAESIADARAEGGLFKGLYDFCERVDTRLVNKSVVESLVKAGAFDSLAGSAERGRGACRARVFAAAEGALASAAALSRARAQGQLSLFGGVSGADGSPGAQDTPAEPPLPDVPAWSAGVRCAFEREVLGFYITDTPLSPHARVLRELAPIPIAELVRHANHGTETLVGGLVTGVRSTTTRRRAERMARFTLEDLDGGRIEAVAFPRTYEACREALAPDRAVFVRGRVDKSLEERTALIAEEIVPIEEGVAAFTAAVALDLGAIEVTELTLERLKAKLALHPGRATVSLRVPTAGGKHALVALALRVTPSPALRAEIEALLGREHVRWMPGLSPRNAGAGGGASRPPRRPSFSRA